ncbi:hypothetical protein SFRURICE_010695 [Spodoptera frugiperda]|nr:hypothetical protein SFRURICE_010695 [Spodoptera frugiperda]
MLKNIFANLGAQKLKIVKECLGLQGRLRTSNTHIDTVSRNTAGKKETITKGKDKMQKRFLLDSMKNLFKAFKSVSINLIICTNSNNNNIHLFRVRCQFITAYNFKHIESRYPVVKWKVYWIPRILSTNYRYLSLTYPNPPPGAVGTESSFKALEIVFPIMLTNSTMVRTKKKDCCNDLTTH